MPASSPPPEPDRGRPYYQFRHGSGYPVTMPPQPPSSAPNMTYIPPPSFSPEVGSMTPLQIDESSQYTSTPELSSDTDLLPNPSNSIILPSSEYTMPGAQPPVTTAPKARVLKAPRLRRRTKPAKADRGSNLVVTEPLSELTKHINHIPLRDMHEWAHRTTEERLAEVRTKNGKIARPMNSFMLYRAAYAERTKFLCAQNNHQVVSRAAGQSWSKEPTKIRELYENLALIERDNHQKAHPNYKFAPNKTQTPPKKKRPLKDETSEGEESGIRGPANSSPMPSNKRARTSGLSSPLNSRDSTPLDTHDNLLGAYQPSIWQVPGGRPMASNMFPTENGYLMPPHPASGAGLMNGHYGTSTSLVGIPGGVHQDLVRSYPSGHAVSQLEESQLDPQLLSAGVAPSTLSRQALHFWQPDQDLGSYLPLGSNNNLTFDHYATASGMEENANIWAGCDDAVSEVGKDFEGWFHPSTYPSQ